MLMRKARWIGPLIFTTCHQGEAAPRIDGCAGASIDIDEATGEQSNRRPWSGYAIRLTSSGEALVIGLRGGHGCPRSPMVALRSRLRNLRWRLQGSPPVTPSMRAYDEDYEVAGSWQSLDPERPGGGSVMRPRAHMRRTSPPRFTRPA